MACLLLCIQQLFYCGVGSINFSQEGFFCHYMRYIRQIWYKTSSIYLHHSSTQLKMHLKEKIYFVQEEELKLLTQYLAVYNTYTYVLALLKKYVSTFPLTYYVYTFEGKCQCKSSAAQITMLRNCKQNFMIFKTEFILSIPRKFVKEKYLLRKSQLLK